MLTVQAVIIAALKAQRPSSITLSSSARWRFHDMRLSGAGIMSRQTDQDEHRRMAAAKNVRQACLSVAGGAPPTACGIKAMNEIFRIRASQNHRSAPCRE